MLAAQLSKNPYCDKVIWNSFKYGDKEAFATLYYRYFGILSQSCSRFSKDRNLIEDCIHDLFLEIWNNKMKLVTPDSVKAYLLCSTQRKVVKQLKKSRNWQNQLHSNSEIEIAHSIEEKLITEQSMWENKNTVRMALDSLTKRQKEAISLRYFGNLGYPEIAIKMEISTDSVYNLVSKAISNIQKKIQVKAKRQNTYLN